MVAATTSSTYLIPVGRQDDERLNALGAIYNGASLDFVGDLPEGGAFLDVGCGNGALTRLFAERYPKTTFVGADISAEQIKVASSAPSAVSWEVCDVYHLDSLKEKYPKLFDVVFCRFILSHVRDVPGALDQMYAMVKPGGSLYILELGLEHYPQHHPETLKAIKAWENMVELQFKLQGSHKGTCQLVAQHAHKKNETLFVQYKEQDFPIKDLEKKLLFSLGMEAGIAKLKELGRSEIITLWGYPDADAWRKDMNEFLNSDQYVTMKHHRWLHIQTRTESEIAALKQAADQSKASNNSIDGNLIPLSENNGIAINTRTEASMAARDNS